MYGCICTCVSLLLDSYAVSTVVHSDSIIVSWTSDDSFFQQQLQSVEVMVTSNCLTGTGVAQIQHFTVIPSEGNSINITGLGMQLKTHISMLVKRTAELMGNTTTQISQHRKWSPNYSCLCFRMLQLLQHHDKSKAIGYFGSLVLIKVYSLYCDNITLLIDAELNFSIDISVAHRVYVSATVCEDTLVEIYNESIIIYQGDYYKICC